jgi:chloramphenicol-sensitive protein RarD
MTLPVAAPADSRQALAAGIGSYIFWGGMPALFLVMGHFGAEPWEILGQRTLWALPCALILVVWARQGEEVRRVLATPRILVWLVVSSVMIAINWTTFVWAVSRGQTLETSLGYYINPLLNMAVGALFFRERIHALGFVAIGLAVAGVVLQAFALHGVPVVALVLAFSFGAYGIIRKQAPVSAQAGLFIECLFMVVPGAAYVAWLLAHGGGVFGGSVWGSLLMMSAGPATVIPLALFSWSARRLPLSTVGFIQFISPTLGFFVGVEDHEKLTPLGLASFAFIWGGAVVFMIGAWRASHRAARG